MEDLIIQGKTVLLLGLDSDLAGELKRALEPFGGEVRYESDIEALRRKQGRDAVLIFCPADRSRYREILEYLRGRPFAPPVVVATRHPDAAAWLDALEAGAADYCAPPFEKAGLRWIIESNLDRLPKAALGERRDSQILSAIA